MFTLVVMFGILTQQEISLKQFMILSFNTQGVRGKFVIYCYKYWILPDQTAELATLVVVAQGSGYVAM